MSLIVFKSFDDLREFARGDMIDHHIWNKWERDEPDLTPEEKMEHAERRAIARGNDKAARTALARHMKADRRMSRELTKEVLRRVQSKHGGEIQGNSWIAPKRTPILKSIANMLRKRR
ncbi:hypothetical protein EBZ80_10575 [bacterium]|nr:hypothetical protein [bacterium]